MSKFLNPNRVSALTKTHCPYCALQCGINVTHDEWHRYAIADVERQRQQHQRIDSRRAVRGRFSDRDSSAEHTGDGIEDRLEKPGRWRQSSRHGEEGARRNANDRQSDFYGEVAAGSGKREAGSGKRLPRLRVLALITDRGE